MKHEKPAKPRHGQPDELTAMKLLYDLSIHSVSADNLPEAAADLLDAAMKLTGAAMGTFQLYDSESDVLQIAAHRGFRQPFLDFFASVRPGHGAACGTALERRQRVFVEDVGASPIFVDTPALAVMRAAGVGAIQSTPLISRSGRLVGMLATHYRQPRRADEVDFRFIDLLAGQAADIIAQIQAQQALQENERVHAFHSAILGSVRDPLWVTDAGLRIMYWNDAATATFGWTADEAQGRNTGELFRTQVPGMTRDEAVAQLQLTGEYRGEVVCHCKDGRPIVVEASSCGVRRSDGEVVRVVTTVRDITERKRLEKELEQHREKLENLIEARTRELAGANRQRMESYESMSDLFYALDYDLRFTYVNKGSEKIWGMSRDDLLGRKIAGVFPDLIDLSLAKFRQALKEKTPQHYEVYSKVARRWIDMSVYPTLDGLSVFYKDITERKTMEAEMQRLDRLNTVGEMAAAIGHEVRNPMTTVRGYLQMMQRKKEYVEHCEQFKTMIEELDRANVIISDFLSLAKNRIVELRPYNLNDVISALLPLLRAETLRTGHELSLDTDDIPDFAMDEKEIRQLLLNLTNNALQAMEPGGRLKIATFARDGKIVLSVSDSGTGIPKEIVGKLGTPFLTTKENGTGLGLAVCYRIAERHGAKIEVDTSPAGTTFEISFPAGSTQ